jgi:hypothetical protein
MSSERNMNYFLAFLLTGDMIPESSRSAVVDRLVSCSGIDPFVKVAPEV